MTPTGSVFTNPYEISLRYLEHSGSKMGDSAGRALSPDVGIQQKLLDFIVCVVLEIDRTILNAPVTGVNLVTAIRKFASGMD